MCCPDEQLLERESRRKRVSDCERGRSCSRGVEWSPGETERGQVSSRHAHRVVRCRIVEETIHVETGEIVSVLLGG
jgi:hypothetical protein